MNAIPSPNGITRRSFIKRSVVAAVAVSSMTILSGLVNAQTSVTGSGTPKGYHCSKRSGVACFKPENGPVDENGNAYWVCECSGDSNKRGICDKGYKDKDTYNWVWCE
jgi:hypothetical protein